MSRFTSIAFVAVAVFVVGLLVARLTVTSGVSGYAGAERALAEDALEASYLMADNPLVANAIVARRVVSVRPELPGDCTEPGFAAHGVHPGHKAEVVGYSIFRLPVVRVTVTCGGTVYEATYGLGV